MTRFSRRRVRAVVLTCCAIAFCVCVHRPAQAVLTYNLANALLGTEPVSFIAPASQPVILASTPASTTTLNIAGLRVTGPSTLALTSLHQSFQGMGVFSGLGDDIELDAVSVEELLVLTFSEPVQLLGVTFTRVGLDDDFGLYVDGATTPAVEGPIPGGNAADNAVSTVPFNNLFGTIFAFAVSRTNPETDDYKIVAAFAVPEPSTLTLFGAAGLCAVPFAIARRKRRSA